mmetsp:Transcript_82010/g.265701  ORF Transcript_82010/g.265701 Transcript_82010/m.265701 type:complete len:307 (+) Transcript_82010:4836-5756(+)
MIQALVAKPSRPPPGQPGARSALEGRGDGPPPLVATRLAPHPRAGGAAAALVAQVLARVAPAPAGDDDVAGRGALRGLDENAASASAEAARARTADRHDAAAELGSGLLALQLVHEVHGSAAQGRDRRRRPHSGLPDRPGGDPNGASGACWRTRQQLWVRLLGALAAGRDRAVELQHVPGDDPNAATAQASPRGAAGGPAESPRGHRVSIHLPQALHHLRVVVAAILGAASQAAVRGALQCIRRPETRSRLHAQALVGGAVGAHLGGVRDLHLGRLQHDRSAMQPRAIPQKDLSSDRDVDPHGFES